MGRWIRGDLDRFNLREYSVHILKDGPSATAPPPTYATTWSRYLRQLFVKNKFYAFGEVAPRRYFMMLDTKVLAGRDWRCYGEGDAIGRDVCVAFFEPLEAHADPEDIA